MNDFHQTRSTRLAAQILQIDPQAEIGGLSEAELEWALKAKRREIQGQRMTIDAHGVDLDAYADADEGAYIEIAWRYADAVWDRLQRSPEARGEATLPWTKTHADIQLRPGELSIWSGKRGQGKSLLLSQAALGLVRQRHRVVIASMEMPIPLTLERMERQALGVAEPARAGHEALYLWYADRLWLYTQSDVVQARRILGLCRYAIREMKAQHVIIDSLMMVGFPGVTNQFAKLEAQGDFVRQLAQIARDSGAHIHLVAHQRKSDGHGGQSTADDVKGAGEITDLASNVYLVASNRAKRAEREKPEGERDEATMAKPDLLLSVEKNRNGGYHGTIGLWLHGPSLQLLGRDAGQAMIMAQDAVEAMMRSPPEAAP